ncbi:hypothetical protein OPQ81_008644 [Rhizoctonia solani]|nr:hypothetical protein OPQ81_008644 [Rhizoctonia solani]
MPLLDELINLEQGIEHTGLSYAGERYVFSLRAFMIHIFGNIAAFSKLLFMKERNAVSPCRTYYIEGCLFNYPGISVYYVPLIRPNPEAEWNCNNLPMHTHEGFVGHGAELEAARTKTPRNKLSWHYIINPQSAFSSLRSFDLASYTHLYKSGAYSFWIQFIAPIALKAQLSDKYYKYAPCVGLSSCAWGSRSPSGLPRFLLSYPSDQFHSRSITAVHNLPALAHVSLLKHLVDDGSEIFTNEFRLLSLALRLLRKDRILSGKSIDGNPEARDNSFVWYTRLLDIYYVVYRELTTLESPTH